MSAPPRGCTKYKSLYPTDSTNHEIAIQRLASDSGESGQSLPSLSSLVVGLAAVRRRFQPGSTPVDDLVEALHELLTNGDDLAAVSPAVNPAELADSACVSGQPE